MRFACALLGIALFAMPAAAQPFIVPLHQQHQSEAPPSAPSPAPVAPPQSDTRTNGSSQADAQPGDGKSSAQAPGAQSDASQASGQ